LDIQRLESALLKFTGAFRKFELIEDAHANLTVEALYSSLDKVLGPHFQKALLDFPSENRVLRVLQRGETGRGKLVGKVAHARAQASARVSWE
jgi:hypothetical protein